MHESEWKTRKTRIDKSLQSLKPKWKIVPYEQDMDMTSLACHAVEEYPTSSGPADYALFVNGNLLIIIEAKKLGVDPQKVHEQAKRYASGCKNTVGIWGAYKVPFLYSSNGVQIWFADVRGEKYCAREISSFYSAEALVEMFERDPGKAKKWLENTLNEIEHLRLYQKDANKAIECSLVENKWRMMLAMAG